MIGLAMPASRSLIALLIGTVVFFALWMIALKPSSSNGNNPQQGSSNTTAAHTATTPSKSSDASKPKTTAASASKPKTASASASKAKTKTAAKASGVKTAHMSVADEMSTVQTAVAHHKVVAMLFYNPAAPDDQALKQELAGVPTAQGQVVKLAIPLNQAANFTAVTQQVPLNLSPTLVLISRSDQASEDVGYTAPFVIDQQVENALAAGS